MTELSRKGVDNLGSREMEEYEAGAAVLTEYTIRNIEQQFKGMVGDHVEVLRLEDADSVKEELRERLRMELEGERDPEILSELSQYHNEPTSSNEHTREFWKSILWDETTNSVSLNDESINNHAVFLEWHETWLREKASKIKKMDPGAGDRIVRLTGAEVTGRSGAATFNRRTGSIVVSPLHDPWREGQSSAVHEWLHTAMLFCEQYEYARWKYQNSENLALFGVGCQNPYDPLGCCGDNPRWTQGRLFL